METNSLAHTKWECKNALVYLEHRMSWSLPERQFNTDNIIVSGRDRCFV